MEISLFWVIADFLAILVTFVGGMLVGDATLRNQIRNNGYDIERHLGPNRKAVITILKVRYERLKDEDDELVVPKES